MSKYSYEHAKISGEYFEFVMFSSAPLFNSQRVISKCPLEQASISWQVSVNVILTSAL